LALRPGRLGSTSIRSPGECRSGGSGEFRFEHKNKIVNSYLSGCLCFALRPDRFGSLSTGRQDECQSGELQFEQHLQVIKLHLPGRPPIRTPARSAQKHFVHEIGRVPTQRAPDRTEPASYKVLPVRGGVSDSHFGRPVRKYFDQGLGRMPVRGVLKSSCLNSIWKL